MERRTILEKLGLIEKIKELENSKNSNDNDNGNENVQLVEGSEPSTCKEEKPQVNSMKNTDLVTEVKVSQEKEEIKTIEDPDNPVTMVRSKKLQKIVEIYKNYNINTDGINSLTIVESFQKALPDYLPTDVKRQSILNIISSSNVKAESLIMDGNDKLKCLKDFSQAFSKESNDIVSNFENEIKRLNEKISNYKTAIDDMKKLQTEQDFTVRYEIDKINNMLQFINPEN